MLEIYRSPMVPETRTEVYQLALDKIKTQIQQHTFDDDTLMMLACTMDAIVKNLNDKNILSSVREKAAKRNVSIDKEFRDDALWCLKNISKPQTRHQDEDVLVKALEAYKIEYNMRTNEEALACILQKHKELDLPLRIIIDRDIDWIQNQRVKQ